MKPNPYIPLLPLDEQLRRRSRALRTTISLSRDRGLEPAQVRADANSAALADLLGSLLYMVSDAAPPPTKERLFDVAMGALGEGDARISQMVREDPPTATLLLETAGAGSDGQS